MCGPGIEGKAHPSPCVHGTVRQIDVVHAAEGVQCGGRVVQPRQTQPRQLLVFPRETGGCDRPGDHAVVGDQGDPERDGNSAGQDGNAGV